MEDLLNEKIGNIVARNFKTAAVFTKYGLDFCCGGQVSLESAAEKKGIDKRSLVAEVKAILIENSNEQNDFNSWPSDLLVSYIVKKHHRYVRDKSPVILDYLNKICNVHGKWHPELFQIKALFEACVLELTHHMRKEEQILFPVIEKMDELKGGEVTHIQSEFGSVQNPIKMMIHEHQVEGDRFHEIAELTNHYTVPDDACTTYQVTFDMLEEFEQDLHKHIHLENNILFPKLVKLEEQFLETSSRVNTNSPADSLSGS